MSAQTVLFDRLGPRGRRTATVVNVLGVALVVAVLVFVVVRLQQTGQLAGNLWSSALSANAWRNFYLPGLQNTLIAALYSVAGALVFGLLFGIGRLSSNRAIRWFCGVVVEFFRAVPVLIMMIAAWILFSRQVSFVGPELAPLLGVIVGLVLYNGSVIAELVRSGVFNLPKGQREAALATGMTRGQSIRSVELPQALIAMLPSLVSQFVVILKDSALGQIITYNELLRSARLLGSGAPFAILQTLFVAALIFIVINFLLTFLAQRLSRLLGGRTAGSASAGAPALAVGGTGADAGAETAPGGSTVGPGTGGGGGG
jgi:glutamate transport system permease protein